MSGTSRARQAAAMIRCPGCAGARKHSCIGRRDPRTNEPLCSCLQCWGAAIRADAELYTDPMVVELRRYVWQVRNRERLRTTWPAKPRRQTCEAPHCGNQAVSRRFGPRRKYCSDACKQRAYRHRRAEREKAGRQDAVRATRSGQEPPGTTSRPEPGSSPSGRTGATGTAETPGRAPEPTRKPRTPSEVEFWAMLAELASE